MRKYTFKVCKNGILQSDKNFRKALRRIGELDPLNVKRSTLKVTHLTVFKTEDMKDRQLINRGVLNVRKRLNRNLGKSGKYTNGMIQSCSEVKVEHDGNYHTYSAKLPIKEFLRITVETYFLLWQCDEQLCKKLLCLTEQDINELYEIKPLPLKTTALVQTDLVVQGGKGKNKELDDFINLMISLVGKEY